MVSYGAKKDGASVLIVLLWPMFAAIGWLLWGCVLAVWWAGKGAWWCARWAWREWRRYQRAPK